MAIRVGDAGVVDVVLTKVAHGYRLPETVWRELFPVVPITSRLNNKVIRFDDSLFVISDDADEDIRAPGSNVLTLEIGYHAEPVEYEQYARAAKIPYELQEVAEQGPGINLKMETVGAVLERFELTAEVRSAGIARNPANYAEAHVVDLNHEFSNFSARRIKKWFTIAIETIRQACGKRPNRVLMSGGVFAVLRAHPEIMEHFHFTDSKSITTEMLASYLDVKKVVVADSIRKPRKDVLASDVWGNDILLAVVPETITSHRQPSYGYTYVHKGYPLVRPFRYDEDDESWKANVLHETKPYLTGMNGGFLFRDVVSPQAMQDMLAELKGSLQPQPEQ